jgi:hypothetical protein
MVESAVVVRVTGVRFSPIVFEKNGEEFMKTDKLIKSLEVNN